MAKEMPLEALSIINPDERVRGSSTTLLIDKFLSWYILGGSSCEQILARHANQIFSTLFKTVSSSTREQQEMNVD